jgi:hypothetical protein
MIQAIVCTICKAKDGALVLASVVSTFSIGREDGTFDRENFDLKLRTYSAVDYDPENELGVAFAACKEHAESIIDGRFGEFITGLEAISEAAAIAEEADLPVKELPEGAEEFEEDAYEEEEEEEEEESPKGNAEALLKRMGEKVKPEVKYVPTPPELQERINAAARVQNPKPGEADSNAVNPEQSEKIEEWQTWFEDGYEPSAVQPKGDEKDACLAWWTPLPMRVKNELAPKGWPERGSLTRKTVLAWHKSRNYAEYLQQVNA